MEWKPFISSTASALSLSATVTMIAPVAGIFIPAPIRPLYKAFAYNLSRPITSPVDFISGPSVGSTLRSLAKENTGTLTDT
ncbi:hypothetical protein D3C78_1092660 [compost metagenome]